MITELEMQDIWKLWNSGKDNHGAFQQAMSALRDTLIDKPFGRDDMLNFAQWMSNNSFINGTWDKKVFLDRWVTLKKRGEL